METTTPVCSCGGALKYVADYAAPGFGQDWQCVVCGKSWFKAWGTFTDIREMDPEDMMLDPCDVI